MAENASSSSSSSSLPFPSSSYLHLTYPSLLLVLLLLSQESVRQPPPPPPPPLLFRSGFPKSNDAGKEEEEDKRKSLTAAIFHPLHSPPSGQGGKEEEEEGWIKTNYPSLSPSSLSLPSCFYPFSVVQHDEVNSAHNFARPSSRELPLAYSVSPRGGLAIGEREVGGRQSLSLLLHGFRQ